jgi:hypothetical protein
MMQDSIPATGRRVAALKNSMSDAWFEFPPLGGGRRVAAALINSMTEEL